MKFPRRFFTNLLAVLIICTRKVHSVHTEVECFPNSTVTLTNPIPSGLFFGQAIDSDDVCIVDFSDDFSLITLNGCSKSEDIVVQLTDVQHTNGIIGGADKVLVNIRCDEIPQGHQRNITQGLSVDLVADAIIGENQTFAQFSYIRMGTVTSPPIGAAQMFDNVLFTYDLHNDYVMTFLQCTAHAGRDTTTIPNSHELIQNDCSVDTDLINSFSPTKTQVVGDYTRYYTELTMFRFWVSMYITIGCDVKICLKTSSAPCTMGTCANTRKRRASGVDNAPDNPGVKYRSPHATFKVLENPNFILSPQNSSNKVTPNVLVLAVLIVLFRKL